LLVDGEPTSGKWAKIAGFLIVGYLCMSRSFAYLGIPPWDLFVGEIVLMYFLFFGPRTANGRWLWLAAKAPSLRDLTRSFLVLLAYGIFQVLRGMYKGNPPLTAARDLAFNYYPLYLFLGLWVGLQSRNFLRQVFRIFAWVNGIYGVVFVLLLSNITWTLPGVSQEVTKVPFWGEPLGSAFALLGLLAFEKEVSSAWYLFLLNFFVLLGMQIRGEWLAFAIGLLLWSLFTRRFRQVVVVGAYVVLLLGLMITLDVRIPGPEGRGGGMISARALAGRALAPIDPDLSQDYTATSSIAQETVLWRTIWWAEIWISVHALPSRALLGYGYGFPLGDLVPYLEGQFIRTPHNFFLYVLGYSGWIGVVVFSAFQFQLVRLLWKDWKQSRRFFGLIFWATSFVLASFTAFFETPYGAIPFYIVVGSAISPALCRRRGAS
jgi:O-Antigen ligase